VRLKCERCDAVTEHQQELREENARLRSALEKIALYPLGSHEPPPNEIEWDMAAIAQQALEPKESE
jgi:hypothetical protein